MQKVFRFRWKFTYWCILGRNYRKSSQNIFKKFSSRDMAGNLNFCFWKRNQIIALSKVAQIQVINTSFDQKLNEESENHHIFYFWRFFYKEINLNIFRFPSIFQFLPFSRKSWCNLVSKTPPSIEAHIFLYRMVSSEFQYSRPEARNLSRKLINATIT